MPALCRVLAADPRAFPTFMRYGANVESAQPSEPHRYLEVLSVRPEHQRHGIGSGLVTPILKRADRDQVPCHLGDGPDHHAPPNSIAAPTPARKEVACLATTRLT
jgi:GNAT superfamily N-acetyltransferase